MTGWQPGWPGTHIQHRLAALPSGSSSDALLTGGSPPPGTGGSLRRNQEGMRGQNSLVASFQGLSGDVVTPLDRMVPKLSCKSKFVSSEQRVQVEVFLADFLPFTRERSFWKMG